MCNTVSIIYCAFFLSVFLFSCGTQGNDFKEKQAGTVPFTGSDIDSDVKKNVYPICGFSQDTFNDTVYYADPKKILWPLFWDSFSNAVYSHNGEVMENLAVKDGSFYDGGGGAGAKKWISTADTSLWNTWIQSIRTGVKETTNGGKITNDDYMTFVFVYGYWYWSGVMGY